VAAEDLFSATVLLFLTMDPLGNVPIFMKVLDAVPEARRRRVVLRELLLALAIMVVFLIAGESLLKLLQLSREAISIAGGIILFLIAIKMVFPVPRSSQIEEPLDGEPLLVPLAIPLVAGPSVLATLLLLVTRDPGHIGWWALALLMAWGVTALILLASTRLQRLLGQRGLVALERLMGLVLVAISVQMFLDGIAHYLGRAL